MTHVHLMFLPRICSMLFKLTDTPITRYLPERICFKACPDLNVTWFYTRVFWFLKISYCLYMCYSIAAMNSR